MSLRTFRRCERLKLISPLIRAVMERISIQTDKQLVLKPETEGSVFPCRSYSVLRGRLQGARATASTTKGKYITTTQNRQNIIVNNG